MIVKMVKCQDGTEVFHKNMIVGSRIGRNKRSKKKYEKAIYLQILLSMSISFCRNAI
jgi:hypothetical protein